MFGLDDLIGGALNIGGGIVGNILGGGDKAKAQQEYQQAIKALTDVGVPSIDAQKLVLDKYKSAGVLTPELEQTLTQGDSELNSVAADPNLKSTQMSALNQLSQLGTSGGMTLTDKANEDKLLAAGQQQSKGARDAIMQNMAARGMSGSGMELASALSNEQNSATNANTVGLDQAAAAQKRALDAITQSGSLAGSITQQELDQKDKAAAAQDAINKYNTMNSSDVQQRNVAAKNTAAATNLTAAQNLSNSNTDIANKEQISNKNLYQQQYDDQMKKAQGVAGAYQTAAGAGTKQGQDTAATWAGVGKGAGQAVVAAGGGAQSQTQQQTPMQSQDLTTTTDDYDPNKKKVVG